MKKIFFGLCAVVLVLGAMFGLVGCGGRVYNRTRHFRYEIVMELKDVGPQPKEVMEPILELLRNDLFELGYTFFAEPFLWGKSEYGVNSKQIIAPLNPLRHQSYFVYAISNLSKHHDIALVITHVGRWRGF